MSKLNCNYSATEALLVENVQNVQNVYDYNDFNKRSDITTAMSSFVSLWQYCHISIILHSAQVMSFRRVTPVKTGAESRRSREWIPCQARNDTAGAV